MIVSPTTDLLQEALALHRRGAIAQAAARYAEVLRADPRNADAHYYLGMMACQQGRFAEGAEHARNALANDPAHARAHVLLGRALSAVGRQDEALASFDRAIALAPDLSQAHGHRADVLSDLGRRAEAIDGYDRALAVAPDRAEDWFNRGVALEAVGRESDAIASLDRAAACKPNFAQAHLLRAKLLADFRRDGEALASADQAIAIEPGLAEAWLARGNILTALKKHDDALAAFDRALSLKPDLAQAWLGRGNACLAAARPDLAIGAAVRSLELGETAQAKALFAQSLRFLEITTDDGRLRSLVQRALSEGWVRPHELIGVCIGLIKLNADVNDCIARANSAWPARLPATEWLGSSRMAALSEDQLLCRALESAPITDISLERLLANVRHVMLTTSATHDAWDERLLGLYCAVARQCFVNDYVVSTTEVEAEQAQRSRVSLEKVLAADEPCRAILPVVVGSYFPLHTLARSEALLDRSWPQCVDALLVQQIKEPLAERQIASTIPALTGIGGGASREVRRQYEESPYPRWTKAGPPALPPVLKEWPRKQVGDVLIAGCGTGLLTVELARAQPQARILAIDLSLASLSCAKRLAQSFDLDNIEFAQADIMRLGSIERQFDFIDVSGVLHHLADPWEGWRVLLSLLRLGGAMQVGLYSATARRNIVAIRELIAHRGYRPNPADIRRCREEIMATEDGSLVKSVTTWSDFFATSECRDLLFHVQESRVTLPEIKSFLAANNLQFTGFILAPPILHQFTARFPVPSAVLDLDCWHAFEIDAPQTFAAMYQFGVHKPGPCSPG